MITDSRLFRMPDLETVDVAAEENA